MILKNMFKLIQLYINGQAAYRYAKKKKTPGLDFCSFGRAIGVKLLIKGFIKGELTGGRYLLNPVSMIRYFEFWFALSYLTEEPKKCLDVSSPKLFSFYIANKYPSASILMINPDIKDTSHTMNIIDKLKINNIYVENFAVDVLSEQSNTYDCIWSISVIEHISGKYDDGYAIRVMYNALKPGGRLILTVPVDRKFWDEYRDCDYYGTQPKQLNSRYFFQRFYDKAAIWERLLVPIGKEPSVVRWFGETTPGRFVNYEKRLIQEGISCAIEDPREFTDNYQEFLCWEEMPGMGVCGIVVEKIEVSK